MPAQLAILKHSNMILYSVLCNLFKFFFLPCTHFPLMTQDGNSLLIIAARAGWAEVFSLLTNAGAALDLQNKARHPIIILEYMDTGL